MASRVVPMLAWLRAWLNDLETRVAEAPFEVPIAVWFGLIGWFGLLSGQGIVPPSLVDQLPMPLVQVWTFSMALGGSGAAYGKIRGHDRIESVSLAFLGWGTSLYAGALVVSVGLPGLTAAAAMLAISMSAALRLRHLHRQYKARKLAADILLRIQADRKRDER